MEREWRVLYAWLGDEITDATATANAPLTPDRVSLTLSYRADALAGVREQMRDVDPSLPVSQVDER